MLKFELIGVVERNWSELNGSNQYNDSRPKTRKIDKNPKSALAHLILKIIG